LSSTPKSSDTTAVHAEQENSDVNDTLHVSVMTNEGNTNIAKQLVQVNIMPESIEDYSDSLKK
jgi:L-lactate utilization protein LutB